MIRMMAAPFFALLLLASAATARAQDLPTNLLGTYASGPNGCAAPQTVLHLTPRSVVTWKVHGEAKLTRVNDSRMAGDWFVAIGSGENLPRMLFRLSGEGDKAGVDQVMPTDKTRDDQLPGDAPQVHLVRCTALPMVFAAIHGEGLAFLHAMEAMEPPCGGGNLKLCGEAFMAYADVTGDHKLTPAELARVARGATWVAQMATGTNDRELGIGLAASTAAGLAMAEIVVHSYDYDGSGAITLDELMKDRLTVDLVPPARSVGSAPLPLDRILPGSRLLQELIHTVIN